MIIINPEIAVSVRLPILTDTDVPFVDDLTVLPVVIAHAHDLDAPARRVTQFVEDAVAKLSLCRIAAMIVFIGRCSGFDLTGRP